MGITLSLVLDHQPWVSTLPSTKLQGSLTSLPFQERDALKHCNGSLVRAGNHRTIIASTTDMGRVCHNASAGYQASRVPSCVALGPWPRFYEDDAPAKPKESMVSFRSKTRRRYHPYSVELEFLEGEVA